jgi:Mg-chelatase subunit ChlD
MIKKGVKDHSDGFDKTANVHSRERPKGDPPKSRVMSDGKPNDGKAATKADKSVSTETGNQEAQHQ